MTDHERAAQIGIMQHNILPSQVMAAIVKHFGEVRADERKKVVTEACEWVVKNGYSKQGSFYQFLQSLATVNPHYPFRVGVNGKQCACWTLRGDGEWCRECGLGGTALISHDAAFCEVCGALRVQP